MPIKNQAENELIVDLLKTSVSEAGALKFLPGNTPDQHHMPAVDAVHVVSESSWYIRADVNTLYRRLRLELATSVLVGATIRGKSQGDIIKSMAAHLT